MIKILKNANFPQWFSIEITDKLGFMDIVDEVKGKALAIKVAKRLAKKEDIKHINIDGFMAETKDL
tara:strand:- start:531 stop:728 length:198 start_codon:yes stop_codon:yes gene_type:complete